jgi:hypothetical protein
MLTRNQIIGIALLGFGGLLLWLPASFWAGPEYSTPRGALLIILIPLAGWSVFDRWRRVVRNFEDTDA